MTAATVRPAMRNNLADSGGGYVGALSLTAAATIFGAVADSRLSLADEALTYVLAVLLTAARFGRGPAMAAALAAFLALNFFFTEPRFTFTISDASNLLTVFYFLATALIASHLAAKLKAQTEAAGRQAAQTENLYAFARKLAAAENAAAVAQTAADHAAATLNGAAVILTPQRDQLSVAAAAALDGDLDQPAWAAAEWAWRNREPAGRAAPTATRMPWMFAPLRLPQGAAGALGVLPVGRPSFSQAADARRMLQALADQTAVALERAALAADMQSAKLEAERERLRAALLSSLSHDLRTPLAAILGAASSLQAFGDDLPPQSRRELAQTALEEAERLNRFVQNLLDMTRIGSGDLKPRADWVDAADVIDAALTRTQQALGDRPVVLDIDPALPLLRADPLLLTQAFVNLLDNAGKYAPPGAPVRIAAMVCDGMAQFAVADRGPGVPAADRERIFDLFFRVEGGDARPAGTGLGLAICRGIVEAHGGTVHVAANNDGTGDNDAKDDNPGACFIVRLPIPADAPSPALNDDSFLNDGEDAP